MFFLCNVLSDDNREDDLKNNQSAYEIYVSFDPFTFEIRESVYAYQHHAQHTSFHPEPAEQSVAKALLKL